MKAYHSSGEIIDLGADLGIIKKSGSWYSYNDTKLGQGRDAAKQCIADNPELAEELEGLIFEKVERAQVSVINKQRSAVFYRTTADRLLYILIHHIPFFQCQRIIFIQQHSPLRYQLDRYARTIFIVRFGKHP